MAHKQKACDSAVNYLSRRGVVNLPLGSFIVGEVQIALRIIGIKVFLADAPLNGRG